MSEPLTPEKVARIADEAITEGIRRKPTPPMPPVGSIRLRDLKYVP